MDFNNGDLTGWAKQGVLLLNKTLTVFEKLSNSHKKIWKGFAEDLIREHGEDYPLNKLNREVMELIINNEKPEILRDENNVA